MRRIEIDPTNLSTLLLSHDNYDNDSNNNKKNTIKPFVSSSIKVQVLPNKGRGLVATKDIAAGECLFCIPPTCNVSVTTAMDKYQQTQQPQTAESLEAIAESLLLEEMKQAPDIVTATLKRIIVANNDNAIEQNCPTMQQLLLGTLPSSIGNDSTTQNKGDGNDNNEVDDDNDDTLFLHMIRRNAFGPEFVTYQKIVDLCQTCPTFQPSRLLGFYPLAAMLNHSCHPNVVKIYKGSILIAHASQAILAGDELVWSYIPPTTSYPQRRQLLQDHYKFTCHCHRCLVEAPVWELHASTLSTSSVVDVPQLEDSILATSNKDISNEAKRYLRMGFCQSLYIPYLNSTANNVATTTQESLLQLCMQLHFTFCACNNASTEHLSILYFCYDLVAQLHAHQPSSSSIQKVRFFFGPNYNATFQEYFEKSHGDSSTGHISRFYLKKREGEKEYALRL